MTTPNIIALVSSSLLLLMSPLRSSAAETLSTADSQEVRALFLRQAAAENAHDLAGTVFSRVSHRDRPIR
jgi:hypothetical protein